MKSVIEIKNLCVNFQHINAVKNINLTIPEGETLGLVGESGSGKSVTSLAVMGLLPEPQAKVTQGEILYKGQNLLELSQKELTKIRGKKITMIFQEPMTSLNPVFKIGDQIIETIILHQKLSKKEARQKALDLLEEVGIPDSERKINDYPHQLSGGQRQRVMIAIAMACEPDLMICDEPTTALDVTIQKQVLELLVTLQKNHKMGLLFISHDLSVVAELAHYVAVMKKGVIVEQGKAADIFTRPQDPYTKGLLACRPSLGDNPKRLLTVKDFSKDSLPPEKLEIKTERKFDDKKNPVILEVKNCTKKFPIQSGLFGRTKGHFTAVNNVSFNLRKGMTLGLVGESGSGKTTLGRTILHLTQPTEGEVLYRGQNLSLLNKKEMREMRKKIQIIFQDPYSSLNPRKTVGEIVTAPM
ncbi:MAG: ATP-binding cassette domain-containing protein, partial [Bdellovibrionota bacterium]|nr:ATP-binding cassette domain-containing protein [Bdellovibrionota bacterium]